jgi:predicted TIM-barrel enzyme
MVRAGLLSVSCALAGQMTILSGFPRVIAALQFPPFDAGDHRPMAWYEDYLLANAHVFVDAGIKAIKIQDETKQPGGASARTVARMAALGAAFRREFPDITLGVIVQAHDAIAPFAIAEAAKADFVRLKVFIGAAVNAEGVRNALGVEAAAYRDLIGRQNIKILADVHDRTAHPLAPVPHATAALWAQGMGADMLVITGDSFPDTLGRIRAARDAGVTRPIVIGGGVTAENVAQALASADAVIVSTALRRQGAATDIVQWDRDATDRFMQACN